MPPAVHRAPTRAIVWTGALLFLASLLYCFFTYEIAMGRPAPAADRAAPVVVDLALFSVFALHHSLFARERVRNWIRRAVGHELERSVYVWIASLMLIAVCALWQPVPGVVWDLQGGAAWLLRAIQAVGVALTIKSAAAIDVFELAGVRQAKRRDQPIEFKTSGPYGWVRHPIYTGWFAVVFAEPTMTATRLVFAAVSCGYLLLAIPLEERSLRETAGPGYERYAKQVRWKLIPGVY